MHFFVLVHSRVHPKSRLVGHAIAVTSLLLFFACAVNFVLNIAVGDAVLGSLVMLRTQLQNVNHESHYFASSVICNAAPLWLPLLAQFATSSRFDRTPTQLDLVCVMPCDVDRSDSVGCTDEPSGARQRQQARNRGPFEHPSADQPASGNANKPAEWHDEPPRRNCLKQRRRRDAHIRRNVRRDD